MLAEGWAAAAPARAHRQAAPALSRRALQRVRMTVHVIGAGLAGLSAAVALAGRGERVVVLRSGQAGRRQVPLLPRRPARHDDRQRQPSRPVGQQGGRSLPARHRRAKTRLIGPDRRRVPLRRPSDWAGAGRCGRTTGRCPGGSSMPTAACPARTSATISPCSTSMRRHPGRRIDEVVRRDTVLWEKFLRPVSLSRPEHRAGGGLGRSRRRHRARNLRQGRTPHAARSSPRPVSRPLSSIPRSIGCAATGADIRLGRSLRAVRLADGRVAALAFDEEEEIVRSRRSRGPGGAALDRRETAAGTDRPGYVPRHPERPFPHRPATACQAHGRPDRRHGGMGLRLS